MLDLIGIDGLSLAWFVAAGLLLNLTPGPDVLYIVTQALRRGARAGVVGGLGITAGCFVHVAVAALGLGALLATSATAFSLLKWLGAAYLLWMGAHMLVSRAAASDCVDAQSQGTALPGAQSWHGVFWGGFLTNVLNPKVALFFLAFVPQFIPAQAQHKTLAFVLLGLRCNLNSVAITVGYALLAARMAARLNAVQRGMRRLERIAGVMFIGFGVRLAMSDNPSQT